MEPETSTPKLGPEQTPVEHGHSVEHVQQTVPERGLLETGNEHKEQVTEGAAKVSDLSGPTVVPIMPPVTLTEDASIADQTLVATPAIAADEDLIEKEWVDRAKKIVADNREDPYSQENAVSQLQKDYRKKRYGREFGEAN